MVIIVPSLSSGDEADEEVFRGIGFFVIRSNSPQMSRGIDEEGEV